MAHPLLISIWLAAPALIVAGTPVLIGALIALTLMGLANSRTRAWVPAVLAGFGLSHPTTAPLGAMAVAIILLFNIQRSWMGCGQAALAGILAIGLTWLTPAGVADYRAEAALFGSLLYLCWLIWEYTGALRSFKRRLVRLHSILREHRRVRTQYQAYLPTQADQAIQSGKTLDQIRHRRRYLVVFFSDIHGFTDRAEALEPSEVADLLNRYLTRMCDIAAQYGGTVDKFIGDSLMVTFGDDADSEIEDNARRALNMALAMQRDIDLLSQDLTSEPLTARMGLAAGYCTTGNFGADNRVEYTAIGKHVNLASRLEQAAEPGQILVSHTLMQSVQEHFEFTDRGQMDLKGFARPVSVYQVIAAIDAADETPANEDSPELERD